MKLKDCKSVVEVGKWIQSKGMSPGEHPQFGGVHEVHTQGSLHYGGCRSEEERKRLRRAGKALDVNDNSVEDTMSRRVRKRLGIYTEHDSLKWLYKRILKVAQEEGWPLDECFFNGYGFIKERGYGVNHAIGGHENHLHVGFTKVRWL